MPELELPARQDAEAAARPRGAAPAARAGGVRRRNRMTAGTQRQQAQAVPDPEDQGN